MTIRIAALLGSAAASAVAATVPLSRVALTASVTGTFGVVDAPDDWDAPVGPYEVRLRVLAFSCNFRDRARLAIAASRATPHRITAFGSEFCAQVVRVGASVRSLQRGARVMGNNSLSRQPGRGVARGIPTNEASMECLHLDARRLVPVPDAMCTTDAAAFALAAQTAAAMVRKLSLQRGERVILASARSITALMALQLATAAGARVTVVSRHVTPDDAQAWRELGAHDVRAVEAMTAPRSIAMTGRFDAAIDPLHDVNLWWLASHLRCGGRVITCGFASQGICDDDETAVRAEQLRVALQTVMARNLTVIGHCLGTTADLQTALRAYAGARLRVPIAAVYASTALTPFLHESFSATRRWGKVVCAYA